MSATLSAPTVTFHAQLIYRMKQQLAMSGRAFDFYDCIAALQAEQELHHETRCQTVGVCNCMETFTFGLGLTLV